MKRVKVEESIGEVLEHDVIQYDNRVKKVLFKRGHVVALDDLIKLKDSGNYYVFVREGDLRDGVHEEEAAIRMATASIHENIKITDPSKGRVRLLANSPGLLKVKSSIVKRINLINDFVIATRSNNTGVSAGREIASMKIIPLTVCEDKMKQVEKILNENKPVFKVIKPEVNSIGVIITGREIHEKRIDDAFKPKLEEKLKQYKKTIDKSTIVTDDIDRIRDKIIEYEEDGLDLIIVTGGMAVDAGDLTPKAIRNTGAEVVSRGIPIFPGNMTMIAYLNNTPILGLPACVIPDNQTSFDLILPRLLAGEKITIEDIAKLGHGGLL